jgi:5-methylcytosine-specific restriction enzyme A
VQWRALRARFLKYHPTCTKTGCGQPATEVDHIESIDVRPDLRLEWSNCRAYCHRHHSQRTAYDQGFARSRSMNEPR